jgi:hypothetical protein
MKGEYEGKQETEEKKSLGTTTGPETARRKGRMYGKTKGEERASALAADVRVHRGLRSTVFVVTGL